MTSSTTSSKPTARKIKATAPSRRAAPSAPKKATPRKSPAGTRRAASKPGAVSKSDVASKPEVTAPASKLEQIVSLLQRPEGASLAELCTATGWQAHSVRGALAGALKRKSHVITSEKVDGVRRYRAAVPL